MIRKSLLALGLSACLGACSLAPEYQRAPAPVPAQWPAGEAYKEAQPSADAPKARDMSYRDFFPDANLRKIIGLALENNRDLRLAALNVEKARAMYGIRKADLYPAVNAAAGANVQRIPEDLSSSGRAVTSERYGVDLGIAAWEIDFFGRIRGLKDQALEEFLATEHGRRSVQIGLVYEVAGVYMTLAADRENWELACSTLASQQAAFAMIKRQYEVGVATELDMRRAETQVLSAQRDIPRFIQQVAQDRNALNLLAGVQVSEELLPANLSSVKPPGELSPELPSEALLSRPDIMAAEHRLKGTHAFIGAARAAFFPRISLTTTIGTASAELSGLFGDGSGTWQFMPLITIPIFDARTWAAYRVSEADRDIALAAYEKTIQNAFREVSDALAVQGTIDQEIASQQALVDSVAETYRLSNKRYSVGIDSYLGVLDAHRSLYAQQQVLISFRLARLANQARLYAVLGGGVQ
ncbi:MAG: efflux transporter outer membrane subunit [Thermodesulfobacteriota bacterium]